MSIPNRLPQLDVLYRQYLADQDLDTFTLHVSQRYTIGTLERVAANNTRMARRAAVLALGLLAEFESNAALGRALLDRDRGVRMLAENGIRLLWNRDGSDAQREQLANLAELNAARAFGEAIEAASRLLTEAPAIAEAWNQRAVALFGAARYRDSIRDCQQALELNPYHFGAAAGIGQCYLQLKDRAAALESFNRALKLNPNLEGIRAQVLYLQRTLKGKK